MKPVVLITMLLGMGQVALAQRTDLRIQLEVNHLDRITRANARVAAKQASVDSDPAKPIFHLMPAAGSGGDPNGLIYAKGKYHVFFQHSPEFEWGKPAEEWEEGQPGYSNTGWGHASSKDLVYWEHEPIALMPERGSYDPNFCASGCTVIADDGTPTIFYTAAEPQTQCIAHSEDPNLRWWLKDERNPILREPDVENYVKGGFRDPFIWREGSTWQMIVCGAIQGVGGTVLYFRSDNLTDWKYVKPLCTGMGEHCIAWECPNFLLFGDKGVFIVSPLFNNLQDTDHAPRGAVSYTIASYGGNGDFTPGPWKSIDIGGPNNFYASNALKTPDGRWLLWGMNLGGGALGIIGPRICPCREFLPCALTACWDRNRRSNCRHCVARIGVKETGRSRANTRSASGATPAKSSRKSRLATPKSSGWTCALPRTSPPEPHRLRREKRPVARRRTQCGF